jgi:hypothetical protein
MANGLIFPYHVVSAMTDGVTRKGKGTQAMVVLGQARSQSRLVNPPRRLTRGAMPAGLTAGQSPIPCLREKPLGRTLVPVPRTNTGGQVENTKVSELTLVKELGNFAP